MENTVQERKTAIVVGGRIKIGFEVCVLLIRYNYHVICTTRFPVDARSRFVNKMNLNELSRLHLYPLDLRNYNNIQKFTQWVDHNFGRINLLVNNAAQTVRVPLPFYKPLFEKETGDNWKLLANVPYSNSGNSQLIVHKSNELIDYQENLMQVMKPVATMDTNHQDCSYIPDKTTGYLTDLRSSNSWTKTIDEIDPVEIVETTNINGVAPAILARDLMDKLKPTKDDPNPGYIVNVTSHEGTFNTDFKNSFHIHNNMSKAALNMFTRSAAPYFAENGILMNAVDPGWVSSVVRTVIKPQLSAIDGAHRILDPFINKIKTYGKLFKDYKVLELW